MLLPTSSILKRGEVPATVSSSLSPLLLLLFPLRLLYCCCCGWEGMHAGKNKQKILLFHFWWLRCCCFSLIERDVLKKIRLVFALCLIRVRNQTRWVWLGTYCCSFSQPQVPAAVVLAVLPLCVFPAIGYYRDTQHGAMEPWSISIHKKHMILRGFAVSEQPLLYRVYVRSVGVYSGIMHGCVRYVLR